MVALNEESQFMFLCLIMNQSTFLISNILGQCRHRGAINYTSVPTFLRPLDLTHYLKRQKL